jgi:hypothetical protein
MAFFSERERSPEPRWGDTRSKPLHLSLFTHTHTHTHTRTDTQTVSLSLTHTHTVVYCTLHHTNAEHTTSFTIFSDPPVRVRCTSVSRVILVETGSTCSEGMVASLYPLL